MSVEEQIEKANTLRIAKLAADAIQQERQLRETRKQTEVHEGILQVAQMRLAHQLASEGAANRQRAALAAWRGGVVALEHYVESFSNESILSGGPREKRRAAIRLSAMFNRVSDAVDSLEEFLDIERFAELRKKVGDLLRTLDADGFDVVSGQARDYFSRLKAGVEKVTLLDDSQTLICPLDLSAMERRVRSGWFASRPTQLQRVEEQFVAGASTLDQRRANTANAIAASDSLLQLIDDGIEAAYLDRRTPVVPVDMLEFFPEGSEQLVSAVQIVANKPLDWINTLKTQLQAEYAFNTQSLTSWKERLSQAIVAEPRSAFLRFVVPVGGAAFLLLFVASLMSPPRATRPSGSESIVATHPPAAAPISNTQTIAASDEKVDPSITLCIDSNVEEFRAERRKGGLDEVVTADILSAIEGNCKLGKVSSASAPIPVQDVRRDTSTQDPAKVIWLKLMSVRVSVAKMPPTKACNAVMDSVNTLVLMLVQRQELANRAFAASGTATSEGELAAQVSILDGAVEKAGLVASAVGCKEWIADRQKTTWWFTGLRRTNEIPPTLNQLVAAASAVPKEAEKIVSAQLSNQTVAANSALPTVAEKPASQSNDVKTRLGTLSVRDGTLTLNNRPVRDVNNIVINSDATTIGRVFVIQNSEVILVHTNCAGSSCSDAGDTRIVAVEANGLKASRSFGYAIPLLSVTQVGDSIRFDYGASGIATYSHGDLQLSPALSR